MLPRWHFFLGIIFATLVWAVVPSISFFYLFLIFFGAFLIDFDHYVASGLKTKQWRLRHSFEFYKKERIKEEKDISKGIKRKGAFQLFHTIEFHILIGLLGIFWVGFFYIFIGMIFHSLLDILSMVRKGALHRREYFFFNWAKKKTKRN